MSSRPTSNPDGHAWVHDKSKFGLKMLTKMGWSEGKGLGANEDGNTAHVKVKHKQDLLGMISDNVQAYT